MLRMSVPQRLIITDLPNSTSHSVTFSYQFTKSGKYAYDFLTSWDQAVELAADYGQVWNDNWRWIGTSEGIWTSHEVVNLPSDPHAGVPRINEFENVKGYGARTIDLYAANVITTCYHLSAVR